MKKYFVITLSIIVLITPCLLDANRSDPSTRNDLTTLILVRHAEKVLDGSEDPALTPDGVKRSQELAYILGRTKIGLIYSTPYKRTRATVAPIARERGLAVLTYLPLQELDFLTKLLKTHRGKTILVCGHSNTIPLMLSILTGNKKLLAIQDHVYDNLFILQVKSVGDSLLTHLKFGSHTPEGRQ
jgi:broad specificity phosphatase PhoE